MTQEDSKTASDALVLTRAQVRRVDQIAIEEYEIPGILLMENAGRGCFDQLVKRGCRGPVVICCGPGNNGGDGFVIARHLDNAGVEVKVLLTGHQGEFSGDAKTNLNIIEKMELAIVSLAELSLAGKNDELQQVGMKPPEWLVDALLGTGATGPPRPPMAGLVESMNAFAAKRMAIDLPTGMDCDTGVCHHPTVCADVTCTFVALKPAFALDSPPPQSGQVEVIDIGVPGEVIRRVLSEHS